MFNRTLRATALLALVIAVATPVAVAAPDPSSPPEPETVTVSSLKGDGRMDYPVADQEVRVSVDARSTYGVGGMPQRSWGTFRISHAQDGKLYWGEFKVDCLTTLDPHTRMGVSFLVPDGGEARIGLSGATKKGAPLLTRCMAPAADGKIVDGGFLLRDRDRD
ncbi:hypothetical protein ABZ445_39590 [Streptomyces chartreusis]|uniref:hypothetical protein n=1 Tax=Streptomyces chartreusis TaxID=1969 RepID=UPI0033E25117